MHVQTRAKYFAVMLLGLALAACGSSPGAGGAGAAAGAAAAAGGTTISGSVGDGPVSGATLSFTDSTGATLTVTDNNTGTSGTTAVSDTKGRYSVMLPATASYPVTVTATGGVDLTRSNLGTANTAPTVPLVGVILDAYTSAANITPFSTLVVEVAKQLGGITAANIAAAKANVLNALSMGLDAVSKDVLFTNPASFTTAEAAVILQANEALGEFIHRTKMASGTAAASTVVTEVAKDLTDGVLDGKDATGAYLASQIATDAVQVRAAVLNDLYTANTVKIDAKLIDGSDSTLIFTPSVLSTVAAATGVTLTATDPYAADAQIKSANASAATASVGKILLASTASSGQPADGTGAYTVIAQVLDGAGNPMGGQVISFSTSGNTGLVTLSAASATTAVDGTASITVSDVSSVDDTVNISARVGAISTGTPLALTFTGTGTGGTGGGAGTGNSITLAADASNLPADGATAATITVNLKDQAGAPVSGSTISLTSTGSAKVTTVSGTTNANGQATFTVTDTVGETVTLTASDGTVSGSLSYTFSPAVNTLTSTVSPASVAADGVTTATVTVVAKDAYGQPVAGEPLKLSVAGSQTAVLDAYATTDAQGRASFTVTDTYAEQVTVNIESRYGVAGVKKSTTATISFVAAQMSIAIAANDPFLADGGGNAFTITVKDANGTPLAGQTMSLTTTGSAQLSASSATTDANGQITGVTISDTVAEAVTLTVTDPTGTNSGSGSIQFIAANPANLNVTASPSSGVTPDGITASVIRAVVTDSYGAAVANAAVQFATTDGYAALSASQVLTDASGVASVNLTRSQAGTATVTVSLPNNTGVASKLVAVDFGQIASSVAMSTSANNIPADGMTSATITVTVTDANAQAIAGQVVSLTSDGYAQLSTNSLITDANGQGTFTVTDNYVETVMVSATADAASTTLGLTFKQAVASVDAYSVVFSNPVDASTGNSVGSALTLDVYTTPTAADNYTSPASGVDTVQVTFLVTDTNGAAIAGQSVNFAASGNLGGTPTITPVSATTDANGQVTATISDTTAETVTISATADTTTGSQQIVFNALAPATIVLSSTSPSPPVIGITGAGSQESATLTFQVVDVNNNPVQGSYLVDFSIVGGGLNGGEALTTIQSSTVNSLTSTVLNSGVKAGTVQVRASLNQDPTIFADATITITGGLPSGPAFGLGASPLNIAGRAILGLTQTVTAHVSDFFSNAVSPYAQVQFQTDFANIQGANTFTDAGNGSSAATAVVTSAFPDPTDGFVTVAAQTIGGVHAKVLALAVDPKDSNIVYAGTDGGGVFKTTDGGTTWQQVGAPFKQVTGGKAPNLTGAIVRDLAVDPYGAIYAATEKGLFVSTNGGQDWNTLTGLRRITGDNLGTASAGGGFGTDGRWANTTVLPGASDVYTFPFHFQSTGVRSRTRIFVNGTETTSYRLTGSGVQIIGTPGATSLAGAVITAHYDTQSPIRDVPFSSVAVDATTYDANLGHAQTIYVGTLGDGVWKTTDGGKTWSRASTMASGSNATFNTNVLALHLASAIDLYAGTDGGGLYWSNDGAATWNITPGLAESVVQDVYTGNPGGVFTIWVAGKNGIHYTKDGGATWNAPAVNVNAADALNLDVRGLAYDATNGRLYAVTYGDVLKQSDPYGGVFVSTDGGANWTKMVDVANAAGAHYLDSIAVAASGANSLVYIGSEGRAVWKTLDAGNTATSWTKIVGTSPATLTNTLFTTMNVMHSGTTTVSIIPLSATYQPMDDYAQSGPGYGDFGRIYNGETHTFYIRVSDDLGNRLTPGTTISVSADVGTLAGDTNVTLADGIYGATDLLVSWANDLTTVQTTDPKGTLTVTVTSNNGNASASVSRTLINPLQLVVTGSTAGDPYTASAVVSGGSNNAGGYTLNFPGGCDKNWTPAANCAAGGGKTSKTIAGTSTTIYYPAGTGTYTIEVRDDATGRTTTANVTF